jgi:MFS family permease
MMFAFRWVTSGVRFSLIPLFATEVVRTSGAVLGFGLTLAALAQLALVWPAGRLADTLGRRALAWPAYAAFGVVVAASGLATTVPAFLVLMACHGIATGLTAVTPPAIVGDVVPAERAGVGVGALSTAGDLGSVVGPLLCGWIAGQAGYGWAFGVTGALLLAAAVVAFRMRETLTADLGHPADVP